jgi:hypothetical protein
MWHAIGRKWATQRKGYSLADLAAVGDRPESDTLLQLYVHADADTVRTVGVNPHIQADCTPMIHAELTASIMDEKKTTTKNRCTAFGFSSRDDWI